MVKVVIVGEVYTQDVSVGGGPMPGGPGWSGPVDPGYGRPEGPGRPDYIWGQRPPHVGGGPVQPPHYPSGQPVPPGGPVDPGWGGGGRPHPGGGPMPGGERPDNALPELPEGGTDVPADEFTPPPPPEDISSQVIVSVYDPRTMQWTTKSYPPR